MDGFRYLSEWRILVCVEHGTAVLHTSIDRHLARQHQAIERATRLQLATSLKQFDLADGLDIPIPPPNVARFDCLPVRAGFQCTMDGCSPETLKNAFGVSQQLVLRHRNKHHKSNLVGKEFGLKPVTLQTFFADHVHLRWFIVQDATASDSRMVVPTPATTDKTALLAAYEAVQEKQAKAMGTVKALTSHTETSPWLRRTGFANYLKDIDKSAIRRLIQMPSATDPHGPKLMLLVGMTIRLLQDLNTSAQIHGEEAIITHLEARILNSLIPGQTEPKPFQTTAKGESSHRYFRSWALALCYVVRMFMLDNDPPVDDDGNGLLLPNITHTRMQFRATRTMVQTILSDKEPDSSQDDLNTRWEKRILALSLAIVEHTLPSQALQAPLLSFAACSALSPGGAWLEPEKYSSFLSGLTYCVRLMLFGHYIQQRPEPTQTSRGADLEDIRANTELLRDICGKWLVNDQHTPMGEINSWRLFGMEIGRQTNPPNHSRWSDDGQRIDWRDKSLALEQWQLLNRTLVHEAQDLLHNSLLLGLPTYPKLLASNMSDIMGNDTPGFSFILDRRNSLEDLDTWLLTKLSEHPGQLRRFSRPSNEDGAIAGREWKMSECNRYLLHCKEFMQLMLVLVHLTAGLPARAPELLGVKFCNGEQRRNVFVEDGVVMILTFYHKMQNRIGGRAVCRFLAPAVGDLLVMFLVLVQPFASFLRSAVGKAVARAEFLFSSDGVKSWTPENFAHQVTALSERIIGVSLNIQAWRQMAIGIDRRLLQGKGQKIHGDDEDTNDGDEFEINSLQASHSVQVGNTFYGNRIDLGQGLTDSILHQYRQVSKHWWQISGMNILSVQPKSPPRNVTIPQLDRPPSHATLRQDVSHSAVKQQALVKKTRKRWGADDLRDALCTLHGRGATFRSPEQWKAMLAISQSVPQVMVVLPTGGGKSLLFQLPTLLPGAGTSVVIVPLVALRQDLRRRCDELRVPYTDWRWGMIQTHMVAPLVLVSVEETENESFHRFLAHLNLVKQLDRIFIDEAHLVVTSSSYRVSMTVIRKIRALAVPIIVLSATLPPSLVPEFLAAMDMIGPTIVRSSANRPNLRYTVIHAQRNMELVHAAGQIVKQRLPGGDGSSSEQKWRAICYVQRIKECERLAKMLQCPFYHGQMEPTARAEAMKIWLSGAAKVIVGTLAFGAGVDYPHVRQVYHVGAPESAIDYAQSTGRGGRDGELATCTTILPPGWTAPEVHDNSATTVDRKRMLQFLSSDVCRRRILTGYLNGPALSVDCTSTESACDRCEMWGGVMHTTPTPATTLHPRSARPSPAPPIHPISDVARRLPSASLASIVPRRRPSPDPASPAPTKHPRYEATTLIPKRHRSQSPGSTVHQQHASSRDGRQQQAMRPAERTPPTITISDDEDNPLVGSRDDDDDISVGSDGDNDPSSEDPSSEADDLSSEADDGAGAELQQMELGVGRQLYQAHVRSVASERQQYKKLLDWYNSYCLLCKVTWLMTGKRKCKNVKSEGHSCHVGGTDYSHFRSHIKLDNYIGCFKCANPEWVCNKFRQPRSEREPCHYPYVIWHLSWISWKLLQGWTERVVHKMTGDRVNGEQAYMAWLGRKHREGGLEHCNAMRLTLHLLHVLDDHDEGRIIFKQYMSSF